MTLEARLIPAHDTESWHRVLDRFGDNGRDPYFAASYHLAYGEGDDQALLYTSTTGGQTLAYPFLLRPIDRVGGVTLSGPERLYDLETVYGYSGPLVTGGDPAFLAAAWAGFAPSLAGRRLVSEFCRFHPLVANHVWAPPDMSVHRDRDTVRVALDRGREAVWQGYQSAQRNRVRKAIAAGLTCSRTPVDPEGMATFVAIYQTTMRWLDARAFYLFSPHYFEALRAARPDTLALFTVHHHGRPIASALFLLGNRTVHYHLGGSLPDQRALAPNNLLFHTVAEWGVDQGYASLFLGGGRTPDPADELLRFKQRFSRLTLPAHFGKRIHDADRYAWLCRLWQEQNGGPPAAPFLQLYRLPLGGGAPDRAVEPT